MPRTFFARTFGNNTGGGGGGSPPAAAVLSIADNGDGTGGVATVDGDAGVTNTIYSMAPAAAITGSQSWTSRGSRSGDGTVSLSMSAGYYWFYCLSSNADGNAISNLVLVGLTGGSAGIEADLKSYLSAQAAVTALVGARVYRGHAPQGSVDPKKETWAPYIVLQRITGGHEHQTTGALGIAQPTIQLSCVAPSYSKAKEVAEAIRGVLDGFAGTMGASTVRVAVLENEVDLIEQPETAGEKPVHTVNVDYRIWVLESTPAL